MSKKKAVKKAVAEVVSSVKGGGGPRVGPPPPSSFLSTGSTLLNLALTDGANSGWLKGKYFFFVGDSSSGKTFFCMTCFAEVVNNPEFKGYRLIYDNPEDGCIIDLQKFFGKKVQDVVEPPSRDKEGNELHSSTIEEFYYNIDEAIKSGQPFVYVLDSMDALSAVEDDKNFDAHKKAHRKRIDKGEAADVSGSYGTAKAKMNSTKLRTVVNRLSKSGSILIIISQTRDNLTGRGQTRSGGKALRFYATCEIWSSVFEKIKKTARGSEREIGVYIELKTKKNRITGKLRDVEVPIYHSYGIDDIGSCIDFLVNEDWWELRKQTIVAEEFELTATKDKLIRHIEENNLESDLRDIVEECWKDIEDRVSLKRKSRYE